MRNHKFSNNEVGMLMAEIRQLRAEVHRLSNERVTTVPIYDQAGFITGDAVEGQVVVDSITNATQNKMKYRKDGAWSTLNPRRQMVALIADADTTGIKYDVQFDFDCVITGWSLLANLSGSVVVTLWKDTEANFPPTIADIITGSAPPTIASAQKASSTTLTGWTTTITAGDVIRINVLSSTTITSVVLKLSLLGT